jgi:hypothetical protein
MEFNCKMIVFLLTYPFMSLIAFVWEIGGKGKERGSGRDDSPHLAWVAFSTQN